MPKGRPLDSQARAHIVDLLKRSNVSIEAIATRVECAKSTVRKVNYEDHVREYEGHRYEYTVKSKKAGA